ncbi:MAG: formylglycine-generating enzyme family protein, partial [Planctomycetota bacterium]
SLAVARAEYNAALVRYEEAGYWEKPAHEVTITKPFYMGKYEVTQEQYKAVTGSNPSSFKGAKNPVETVSWNGAQEFCKKLGEPTTGVSPVRMGTGGTPAVRLPTAAQWEYACRAGTRTRFCSGDRDSDLDGVGWYGGNSGKTTHPVGLKTANNWGLYDMHGNVWEWCQDWAEDYRGAAATDPLGAGNGTYCVTRGGSWRDSPRICRSAIWYKCIPDPHNFDTGFRVIVEVLARTP